MRKIVAAAACSLRESQRYVRKFATRADYRLLVNENCRVETDSGDVLAVLLKKAITPAAGAAMYGAIKDNIEFTNNRGSASGQVARFRINKDGTTSKQIGTQKPVASSVMGFFDRSARFPYCRATAFALRRPAAYAACLPAIAEASDLLRRHAPERYAAQMAVAAKTHPDFMIPRSCFTTVTLNKNFRTSYHQDAGDLPEGFGVMSYYKSGCFEGGHLVFPRFAVGFELGHHDVILFDPHEVHGNTAIKAKTKKWERITCVHYYRKHMLFCGSAGQELETAARHDPQTGARKLKKQL